MEVKVLNSWMALWRMKYNSIVGKILNGSVYSLFRQEVAYYWLFKILQVTFIKMKYSNNHLTFNYFKYRLLFLLVGGVSSNNSAIFTLYFVIAIFQTIFDNNTLLCTILINLIQQTNALNLRNRMRSAPQNLYAIKNNKNRENIWYKKLETDQL